jgi:hypothetical protein
MVRGGRVPDYLDAISYLRGKKDIVHRKYHRTNRRSKYV